MFPMTALQLEKYLRSPSPLLVIGGICVCAMLAFVDCVFYQLLRGEVDLPVAAIWLLAAVPPWVLAWLALGARPLFASGKADVVHVGIVVGGALCAAVLADMLMFPNEADAGFAGILQRARAELPIAIVFYLIGIMRRRFQHKRTQVTSAVPVPDRLIGCDLCRAAGNYVEVMNGERTELVRASLSEVEARLSSHGYIRVHRSAIVRKDAIARFENDRSGLIAVWTRGGLRLRVGRSYRSAVYELRGGRP